MKDFRYPPLAGKTIAKAFLTNHLISHAIREYLKPDQIQAIAKEN